MSKSIFVKALEYANLGYEVFPVVPGDKKPLIAGWPDAATTDEKQIEDWAEQWPDANIGIKAGTNILIIDIDNKNGKNGTGDMKEIIKDLGELPDRPTVKTPTGGYHLYFKHSGGDIVGRKGVKYNGHETGLDVQFGNQFIIAPPSIHPNGGEYRWSEKHPLVPVEELPELPQAWVDNFLPQRDAPATKETRATDSPAASAEPSRDVVPVKIEGEKERKAVKYLADCPRAIQGKKGRVTLYNVAIALVRGLKLEPQRAAEIAWTHYNPYCVPMWGDGERKEFDRMFSDAAKTERHQSDGWLIDAIELDDAASEPPLAWVPFPIDCLPPVLRDVCREVAQSTVTDPALCAACILPVVSSAIGSLFVLRMKYDWDAPAILWSFMVADSGSRKSPVLKFVTKPLRKKQLKYNAYNEEKKKEYEKALVKYSDDLTKWKQERKTKRDLPQPDKPEAPKEKCCWVSDITTEALIPVLGDNPYGVCAIHNEGMSFFGSMNAYRGGGGNKDEGVYNDLYDGGPVSVIRRSDKQWISADQAYVSIVGGIQPKVLRSILLKKAQLMDSGFFARLLVSAPPDRPGYYTEESVSEKVKNAYYRMIETLFFWRGKIKASPQKPHRVKLTPEAKELFIDYNNVLEGDRHSLPPGAMKASLSKLKGSALRIALTLHIANFASHCPKGWRPKRFPDVDENTM